MITGATSEIGQHLIYNLLSSRSKVVALSRSDCMTLKSLKDPNLYYEGGINFLTEERDEKDGRSRMQQS